MHKQHAPKATLFLMELITVIFFFSICAAICISVFGSGQQMARNSHNLSNAVMEARSAASCYKAVEGDLSDAAALLDAQLQDGQLICYFEQTWQKSNAFCADGFVLTVKPLEKAGEASITVQNSKADSSLYQLRVKSKTGGRQDE